MCPPSGATWPAAVAKGTVFLTFLAAVMVFLDPQVHSAVPRFTALSHPPAARTRRRPGSR